MRQLEIFIGLIFLFAAALFVVNGVSIEIKSSMYQIYQMMYFICSILCFGFGWLMIKSISEEKES